MTGVIATIPKHQFFDNNGNQAASYKLYTYTAGTLTPATTWQNQALSSANTNPIILDARGECDLWLTDGQEYKFILATAADVTVWTVDDISGPDISGLVSTLRTELAAYNGGSLVGFKRNAVSAVLRNVYDKLQEMPSARDMGAVLDGIADDTVALQACLDSNRVYVLDGKARTTAALLINPARNRNCGFISPSMLPSRYPYTQQSGGPVWTGTQESVIFYDGATSASVAVVAASSAAVGTEPASTFDATIWGMHFEGITIDANSKAGFGLYTARVQDLNLIRCKARGATVAGVSINGTYSGNIESLHCYLNPGRGFEMGDADRRWGWTAQDKVNALYIRDLHCDANGSASEFREADAVLKTYSCGAFIGPHRGVAINGIVCENNFGANIVFAPSSNGNSIEGFYTELGCKYAPGGAGTDAISLGYATQQWGVIFIGATGGGSLNCAMRDGVFSNDWPWLTGTSPSSTREEGAFEFQNVSLSGGLKADWAAYRLVNCALEMESITGTAPTGTFTLRGGLQFGAGKTNLDTYEEGTWTPALAGITAAGTGWAYSVAAGDYTRIGRHVFFTGRITLSAVSADATGQIAVTGLPFTVRNANNANSSVNISNVTNLTTAVVSIDGAVTINNTRFTLQKRTAAAVSASSVVLADLAATTSLTFSGHFTV